MNLVAGFGDYTKSFIGAAGTLATCLLMHMGLAIGLFLHIGLDLAFFYPWALTLIWASTSHLAFFYIWALNRLRPINQVDNQICLAALHRLEQDSRLNSTRAKEERRRTTILNPLVLE